MAKHRNNKILEARLSGRTLEDIAQEYGVTRERIRQVVQFTLARLSETERKQAEGLMAVNLRGGMRRHLEVKRATIVRELRALFKTEFNREKILTITGTTFTGTDLELCAWLYGKYRIKGFFKWRRCWRCKEIKPSTKTFIKMGLCTPCNTIRHREVMLRHPEFSQKALEHQRAHPNYARLCSLRSYYKKREMYGKMPPLPPRGTPDDQIVLPPKQTLLGWERYQWREKKAKRLVIEEARSRGIDAEL